MSDLVVPPIVSEEELIVGTSPSRRRLLRRTFQFPHGPETWLLTVSGRRSALVYPRRKNGEVGLLRTFRPAPSEFTIEFPGGNPDSPTEIPEVTASRELREESGDTAYHFKRVADGVWLDPASSLATCVPFAATDCYPVAEPKQERTEIKEHFVVAPERLIEMIKSGEIKDAKTIATTFLVLMDLGHISFHF